MDNNLQSILETFNKERENLHNKLAANAEIIKRLDAEEKAFFQDCETIKERLEVRKVNIEVLKEIEARTAAAYENESILKISIKACNEMYAKSVANALRADILSNPEKWNKYPLHFKKADAMINDFLSGTGLYLRNSYGNYYLRGRNCNSDTYVFEAENGTITEKNLETLKNRALYKIIPAKSILTECRKALKARKKILVKFANAKKEIDSTREPFTHCGAFYDMLPYIIRMENENNI